MIFGHVVDPQSSAVAGAAVVVTNLESNTSVHLTTNETGYYEANLLLPGNYQVTAEAAGFKRLVRSGIALTVGTRSPIELRLEIGAVTDSVSVKAEAPLLETNAMTSGRIMENRSVMQLPVLSNTVMQLVKFSPGLQNDGQNRFFNMTQYRYLNSGYTPGRIGGNEWAIDGVPNIGQDRKAGEMPFTDVVEEFKVE